MQRMRKASFHLAIVVMLGAVLGVTNQAAADVIVAPVAGVINAGGPGFGSLSETFDQSGLSSGYISGVTDFDAYLATNPTHTDEFSGFEWFSNSGTTSATVTYDLGTATTINRLALWNEESSGIGLLNLLYSLNNVTFLPLASVTPFDNPIGDYAAQVFGFAPTVAQYVRFEMSNCPQPDPGSFPACAIGEVAFASGAGPAQAPEPGLIALMALGLGGIARRLHSQKRQTC